MFMHQRITSTKWKEPTAWKNIFICKSDICLGLESRTYTTQCEKVFLKNEPRIWIDISLKIHKQPINTWKEKCLASLVIREMQMRITRRKHFTPTGIALIKNTVTSVFEDMDNLEPSCLASGNVKRCSPFWKPFGSSSRS